MSPIVQDSTTKKFTPYVHGTLPSKTNDLQNRFITMLVTELKNQDPLNPLDNKDMIAQLAQISTVQGITELNQSMKQMNQDAYVQRIMESSFFIGKKVKYADNQLHWDGQKKITGSFQTSETLNGARVTITDPSGETIRTLAVVNIKNRQPFQWDGKNDQGIAAPTGRYTLHLDTPRGQPAGRFLQENEVQSIGQDEHGIVLLFNNDRFIHLGDIEEFGKSV